MFPTLSEHFPSSCRLPSPTPSGCSFRRVFIFHSLPLSVDYPLILLKTICLLGIVNSLDHVCWYARVCMKCLCQYLTLKAVYNSVFYGRTEWEQKDLGLNPRPSSAQPWDLGLIIKLSELQGVSAKWSLWRVFFMYENPFTVPLV